MDNLRDIDSGEFSAEEKLFALESEPKPGKSQARQRYDRLMEEKRLARELEDDLIYWQ